MGARLSPEIEQIIARVRAAYGDTCFACGRDNPHGLHLQMVEIDPEGRVHGRFQARPDFGGAHDTLHGGVAATALDELAVWAGILQERVMSVTATLDLRYRRPLKVGGAISGFGRVLERSGRRLRVEAALTDGDRPAIEARGLYLVTAPISEL